MFDVVAILLEKLIQILRGDNFTQSGIILGHMLKYNI